MNTYKIDFAANTITITANFAKAMNDPASNEYEIIAKVRKDFPKMKIVRKTHATPKKYVSKSTGEKFNCNQFKNLTYKNMETFINGLPNSKEYMDEYDFLKAYAAEIQTSAYTLVRRWFVAQFPDFRKNPLVYLANQPAVVSAAEVMEQCEDEAA